jgi:hypothetical protein
MDARFIVEGNLDLPGRVFCDQPPLDLGLLGDCNDQVALDHGLAGEGEPGLQVFRRETDGRAPAGLTLLDDDGAAATAALAAARLVNGKACLVGSLDDQGSRGDLDRDILREESHSVGSHATTAN